MNTAGNGAAGGGTPGGNGARGGAANFASELLGRVPGAPLVAEEDDPLSPGLPPSKHAEVAIEITDDDGGEWLIEYGHRIPGRTSKAGVAAYEFKFTDGDKTFTVSIKGDQGQYGEFKRLMLNFVWCRLRNMRPKGPISSIKVGRC